MGRNSQVVHQYHLLLYTITMGLSSGVTDIYSQCLCTIFASPIGFEPTIFSVTGRHVNRYTTGPEDDAMIVPRSLRENKNLWTKRVGLSMINDMRKAGAVEQELFFPHEFYVEVKRTQRWTREMTLLVLVLVAVGHLLIGNDAQALPTPLNGALPTPTAAPEGQP